jgi:hypothetical protein
MPKMPRRQYALSSVRVVSLASYRVRTIIAFRVVSLAYRKIGCIPLSRSCNRLGPSQCGVPRWNPWCFFGILGIAGNFSNTAPLNT